MKSRPKNDFSAVSRESQPIRKVTVPRHVSLSPVTRQEQSIFSQSDGGGRAGRPHARGRAVAGVGAGGRGARREGGAGKPTLSAVNAALRVRLGIASDLSARASGIISDRPDAAVVSPIIRVHR